jgi:isoleucyl-tRNA synthetase
VYVVTLLMAPLTPFITERVWQDMFAATSDELPESVHLASWPREDGSLVDDELSAQMSLPRRLVELGRAARADAKVRIRQPLRRALVASSAWSRLTEELRQEVAAELNVLAVEPLSSAGADLVDFSAKGNFRALGKRFGKQTPVVAAAIAAADAAVLAASLKSTGTATVVVDGTDVEVTEADVLLSERPKEGWSVVNEQGETVALDLEVTPELRRAGLAREVVRTLQEARKNAGLEVSDRIRVWLTSTDTELTDALGKHADEIAREVLAVELNQSAPSESDVATGTEEDLQLTYWLTKA